MKTPEFIKKKYTAIIEFRPTKRGTLELAGVLGATVACMAIEDYLTTDFTEKPDEPPASTTTSTTVPVTYSAQEGSFPPVSIEE